MKRTLLIIALFLVFSAVSEFVFCQTTNETVVIDKQQVSSEENVYFLKDVNTDFEYVSIPTKVQLTIGEHVALNVQEDIGTVTGIPDLIFRKRPGRNKFGDIKL